jgi:hypothetical protein
MSGAMLDCAMCGSRKWKSLEDTHAEDLRISGAAKLFCEGCTRETYWMYSQHSDGAAAVRRTAEPPSRATITAAQGAETGGAPPPPGESAGGPTGPVRSMQTERRVATDRRGRARRSNRRVALQTPVRVRVISAASQFEEITRTMNVSRNGLYFQSERPYTKGLPIYVAMNYSSREPAVAPEQKATVVRVDSVPGSATRGIAIQMH